MTTAFDNIANSFIQSHKDLGKLSAFRAPRRRRPRRDQPAPTRPERELPGATLPQRFESLEEAREAAQRDVETRPPPTRGRVVSPLEALRNLELSFPTTFVEPFSGPLQELTREFGPIEAWKRLTGQSTDIDISPLLGMISPILPRVSPIRDVQVGTKGAAELFLQPDILAPAVSLAPRAAGAIARRAPALFRAANANLKRSVPQFRRALADQRGAITLGGVPEEDVDNLLREIDDLVAASDAEGALYAPDSVPIRAREIEEQLVALEARLETMPDEEVDNLLREIDDLVAASDAEGALYAPDSVPIRAREIEEQLVALEARLETMQEIVRPPWARGISNEQLLNLAEEVNENPYRGDWADSIDTGLIRDVRRGGFKGPAAAPTMTQVRRQITDLRRELKEMDAEARKVLEGGAAPEPVVPAAIPEEQIGAVRAGMGIGERPPRVMGKEASLVDSIVDDQNTRTELYKHVTGTGGAVRQLDVDTGQVVHLIDYPDFNEAKRVFRTAVLPDRPQVVPGQATLGEGFETGRTLAMPLGRGAGEALPLADPEALRAAQASRQAIARGQQVLPEEGLTPRDTFQERFANQVRIVNAAEKHGPFTLDQAALIAGDDWKAFSRARGYTESEIADYQKFVDLVEEGQQLGFSVDDLASIDRDVVQGLRPRAVPTARTVVSGPGAEEAQALLAQRGITAEIIPPGARTPGLAREVAGEAAPPLGRPPPEGPPPAPPPEGVPPGIGGVPPPGEGVPPIMGNFSGQFGDIVEIAKRPDIWRVIANAPGVRSVIRPFNPSGVAASPAEHAIVGRAVLRDQTPQLSTAAMVRLNRLGTQSDVFGAVTPEGLISEGPLRGLTVNTVRSNPSKYADRTTPAMKEWIQAADDIERGKLQFLRDNGIEINELTFEEGGQYAGRRVYARVMQNGEVVESGFVGPGPARPGAKLAAEKTRVFGSAEEAIAEGYRYIPDDEALTLNVQGAYNRVADKRMADWILLQVPWRTTGAPEGLKIAAFAANQRVHRARQLLAALNRGVRGERVPEGTLNSIGMAFPVEGQGLKAILRRMESARLAGRTPRTARDVQALTARAKELIANAKVEEASAISARARAREAAQRVAFDEAAIPAPAFGGKILTGGQEAKETARVITESLNPQFSRALGALNQVNSVSRYFTLAGDASPMMIQLLFLAGANPRVYGKAIGGFVRALSNPRFQANYLNNPANVAIIQKYPNLILSGGGRTEFTEAMARGGLLRKGPLKVAGKVLEPFQRGFEGALDVAGIELAKSLDNMGTSPDRIADIAQFVNEFRGLTSSARLGVSTSMRQAETAALLAARYNRAIAGLLFDVGHGGLRGDLARRALGQGVAAVAAMSLAISWAMGESPEEMVQHLNPANAGKFLTWEVAGQKIGPGTKVRSVLRLFGASANNPSNLGDTSVGWGPGEFIRNPLIKFIRGNSSPAVSTAWDLFTGKDYIGDPTREGLLDFTETVLKRFAPIWTQTVAFEGGTALGRGVRGAGEFFGLRAYPVNRLFELEQEWEGDTKPYFDISTKALERTGISRTEFRRQNPEVDAKLFIIGKVKSLQTFSAAVAARRLLLDLNLRPDDVEGLKERRQKQQAFREAGRFLDRNNVDELITLMDRTEVAVRQESAGDAADPSVITETPRARNVIPVSERWGQIRPFLDSHLLKALQDVWGRKRDLTDEETRRLRLLFGSFSFGASNFHDWVRMTLRQAQSVAANAGAQ